MEKIAFVFPGQGSQKVGMGSDLFQARPELFDRYFDLARDAAGLDIRKLALEGPIEELTRTDVAQPALFALSLAVAEVAAEAGLEGSLVAGHSLGEYTAAVACGALPLEEGMGLVSARGRLMAEIQNQSPGGMAAIIGLEQDVVERLCAEASQAGEVAPANLNTPAQIVVSGESAGIERIVELAQEAGARRALQLQVGAAFHSRMMQPVQEQLAKQMETIDWSEPRMPMASNASGRMTTTAQEIRQALIDQIASPVRWVDCVRTMVEHGCTTFLELGPGRVLSGLVRQIKPDAQVFSADSPAALSQFLAVHS
jgi:[acyl-carrier-protein] S-malonyltransferase